MSSDSQSPRGSSRLLILGLVALVAAIALLGWRLVGQKAVTLPVSQEAAPTPAAAPTAPQPQPESAPSGGERLAG